MGHLNTSQNNNHFSPLLDIILDTTKIGLWDWDLRTGKVIYSKQWEEILGYEEGELPQTVASWENALLPEDLKRAEAAVEDYLRGVSPRYEVEFRMVTKSGAIIWGQDKGTIAARDEKGTPIRLIGVLQDITKLKLAEEEVKKTSDQLNFVADVSQLGAWEWDLLAETITYNDHYLHMLGYTQAEVGSSLDDWAALLHPEDEPIASKALDDYIDGVTDSYSCEVRMRHKEGHYVWTLDTGRICAWDEVGKPTRVLGGHLNIHQLKEAEESLQGALAEIEEYNLHLQDRVDQSVRELERQDQLLGAVNQVATILLSTQEQDFSRAIFKSFETLGRCVDVDRVYLWQNHIIDGDLCCTQIYEWSEDAPPQQNSDLTVNISYKEAIPTWKDTFERGRCVNAIVKNMTQSERDQLEPQGIVSLLVVPIYLEGALWGFIGFDDCQEERIFTELEETLLQSGALLIASALIKEEVNRKLMLATEEALSSTQAKSSFLANMSHEIRTPMNAIIGMITIASGTDDMDRINDCLEKVLGASKHLLGIINDILDMSKIEANKFEMAEEAFSLGSMIANVENIFLAKMEEKKQRFLILQDEALPKNVISDELRITQVLTNILSNANKFTPEGGDIRFSAELLEQDGDRALVRFVVEDSGIGISPENQKNLFNAFEQLDKGVSKRFGGTGLGLAISKNIVTLLGGEILVDSAEGRGTTFTVLLPMTVGSAADILEAAPLVSSSDQRDFSGFRLLLAEDIEINREIVVALLEDTGIQIDCAENGQLAYETFLHDPEAYDIIYMDIHMPVLDGFGATQKIRAIETEKAKTIPIVAMTANAFQEDIQNCLRAGMNDHIAKPIDLDMLMAKTRHYLFRT